MSRLGPGDADLHYVGGAHREASGHNSARDARHARRLDEHLTQHEYIDELVGASMARDEDGDDA